MSSTTKQASTARRNIVLLGDSIFDNGVYVPGQSAVIDHARRMLPEDCAATLIARDGDVIANIGEQLACIPDNATHLALSIGGNDALQSQDVLTLPADNVYSALGHLADIQESFQRAYRAMLWSVLALQRPTVVCTIYDAVPGLQRETRTALSIFNDIICREVMAAGVPLIDLRSLLCDPGDYSEISPIEPSAQGGEKIARAIAGFMRQVAQGNCHAL